MRKYEIVESEKFMKKFGRLSEQERALVERKVKLLSENPSHPSLRSQRMRGWPGLYEFSVNMDIRILWKYKDGRIILLLNIGHHDILKRY